MKKNKLTNVEKFLYIFLGLVFVGEFIFMLICSNKTIFMFGGMFILCLIDTVVSFVRNSDLKWFEFIFTMTYIVLLILNCIILCISV